MDAGITDESVVDTFTPEPAPDGEAAGAGEAEGAGVSDAGAGEAEGTGEAEGAGASDAGAGEAEGTGVSDAGSAGTDRSDTVSGVADRSVLATAEEEVVVSTVVCSRLAGSDGAVESREVRVTGSAVVPVG